VSLCSSANAASNKAGAIKTLTEARGTILPDADAAIFAPRLVDIAAAYGTITEKNSAREAIDAAAAIAELVHLVTRPADIAEVVAAGAKVIDLKGYRVPLIESAVGAGTWLALVAGAALALVGLVAVVVPAWRARR
jgi:hypothetical protein